ncbi:MAG: excinuclease ABC subunit UvrC [Candidatus Omnitrophica bacterium]|nr:excinuclease ABC subunit UvrC [Candidatus Omnitrophota bacterium]
MDIKEILKRLPDSPGVYLMKDKSSEVIYVGKAQSIKKRVSSYFQKKPVFSPRIGVLISNTYDVDYIKTSSEAEALLLENSLIKEKKPRYNVALKDDKGYPFVKVTTYEDFPRIFITRKRKNDKVRYFGPYTNVKLLKKALSHIRRVFPYRSCIRMPRTACLFYSLSLCPAPCVGAVNKISYQKNIKDIIRLLEGKKDLLFNELTVRMEKFSKNLQFEEAAKIRDQLTSLTTTITRRKSDVPDELKELKKILNLKFFPNRIEAFDISNIGGKEAVGSMVSFIMTKPNKSGYRRFRIKTVKKIDDFSMIKEIISRRYKRVLLENITQPDLILIDGGRAHLRVASETLKELGLDIPIIAIAKEPDRIYVLNRKLPIVLTSDSKTLHLIQRIRDEAHRFAISYHKKLRAKKLVAGNG